MSRRHPRRSPRCRQAIIDPIDDRCDGSGSDVRNVNITDRPKLRTARSIAIEQGLIMPVKERSA
jgi:hypothetical protein